MLIGTLLISGCTKTHQTGVKKHEVLLSEMYQYLSSLTTQPLKLDDLKRFYTPKVVMITNGRPIAQGYQGFYQHFQFMLNKTHQYKFIFPNQSMMGEGNRVAVKYNIDLTAEGKTEVLHVIALFTFQNGKIIKWDEVVSKDSPHAQGLTQEKS